MKSQDGRKFTFNLVLVYNEKEKEHFAFAANIMWSDPAGMLERITEEYKKRWGIETGYRCMEQMRPHTASKNASVRIMLFYLTMIMYNISKRERERAAQNRELTLDMLLSSLVTLVCSGRNAVGARPRWRLTTSSTGKLPYFRRTKAELLKPHKRLDTAVHHAIVWLTSFAATAQCGVRLAPDARRSIMDDRYLPCLLCKSKDGFRAILDDSYRVRYLECIVCKPPPERWLDIAARGSSSRRRFFLENDPQPQHPPEADRGSGKRRRLDEDLRNKKKIHYYQCNCGSDKGYKAMFGHDNTVWKLVCNDCGGVTGVAEMSGLRRYLGWGRKDG